MSNRYEQCIFCKKPDDGTFRFVTILGVGIELFCSKDCLEAYKEVMLP